MMADKSIEPRLRHLQLGVLPENRISDFGSRGGLLTSAHLRQVFDRPKSARPRRAAKRLRRLTESADEGAAHPLRITKAGRFRNALDRLTRRLDALPRHFDTQPL